MKKQITIILIILSILSNAFAAAPGNSVPCSTNGTNCTGCGVGATSVSNAQALFTYDSGNSCKVIDCNLSVDQANLNGWVCSSCNGVPTSSLGSGDAYFATTHSCLPSNNCMGANFVNSVKLCTAKVNGASVSCSSNGTDCTGCGVGATNVNGAQGLFDYVSGNMCQVQNCAATINAANLNGWVCNSCNSISGSVVPTGDAYSAATSTCSVAASCAAPATVNSNKICTTPPAVAGNSVACSSNGTDCKGCGTTTTIQGLFTYVSGSNCKVIDCSSATTSANLNGWVCNSCNGQTGSIVPAGPQYNGSTCAASCSPGQTAAASNSFICTAQSSTNIIKFAFPFLFAIIGLLI